MTEASSQNDSPREVRYIWCSVSITKKMEDVFIGYILGNFQNKIKVDEYIVYLSTTGGDPFAAVSLYNFLKSLPQITTVYNMGTVASAGVPFFLGFQNRIGVPDCSFLIHQTTTNKIYLPDNVSVFDLNTQLAKLSATDDKTQRIIHTETSGKGQKTLTLSKIKKAFLETTNYNSADAKKYGFIEKVETPTLPTSNIYYLTDAYLATLPG